MNKYHISYEIFFCDCGTTKIVSNNTEPESKQTYSSPGSNKDPNSDQQFYYKIIQGPSHRNVSLYTLLHTKKKKIVQKLYWLQKTLRRTQMPFNG